MIRLNRGLVPEALRDRAVRVDHGFLYLLVSVGVNMQPQRSDTGGHVYAASAVEALRGALRDSEHHAILRVRGHCMAPLIRDSDLVHLRLLEERPPLGALVVATDQSGELVCHRVIDWRADDEVVICGDRSSVCTICRMGDIVGIVAAVERSERTRGLKGSVERRLNHVIASHHRLELRFRRSRSMVSAPLAILCRGVRECGIAASRLGWLVAGRP